MGTTYTGKSVCNHSRYSVLLQNILNISRLFFALTARLLGACLPDCKVTLCVEKCGKKGIERVGKEKNSNSFPFLLGTQHFSEKMGNASVHVCLWSTQVQSCLFPLLSTVRNKLTLQKIWSIYQDLIKANTFVNKQRVGRQDEDLGGLRQHGTYIFVHFFTMLRSEQSHSFSCPITWCQPKFQKLQSLNLPSK